MKSNIFTVTTLSLSLFCGSSIKAIEFQEDSWAQARVLRETIQKKKLVKAEQLNAAVEAGNTGKIQDALKGLTSEQCLELFMTPDSKGSRAIDALIGQYVTASRDTIIKYGGLSLDLRLVCEELPFIK